MRTFIYAGAFCLLANAASAGFDQPGTYIAKVVPATAVACGHHSAVAATGSYLVSKSAYACAIVPHLRERRRAPRLNADFFVGVYR